MGIRNFTRWTRLALVALGLIAGQQGLAQLTWDPAADGGAGSDGNGNWNLTLANTVWTNGAIRRDPSINRTFHDQLSNDLRPDQRPDWAL